MLRVYLDQNHWIYLSKAFNGAARSDEEADAARMICASVEAGYASYPLSTAHVYETWKTRRAERRLPLARAMALISQNHAIAPPGQLLPPELDRALQRRFGRPERLLPLQPFGHGMAHLSGGIAPALDPEIVRALRQRHPELAQRHIIDWNDALLLAGPAVDLPFGEIRQPPLHIAETYAAEQQAQLGRFAEFGSDQDERRRAVAAHMLLDIRDPLQQAQVRAGLSTDQVLALGADGLTDFMLDLPSRVGLLEMTWQQHANPQTRWAPNDLNDLVFLSLAVGYCDVVVTERRWHHMLTRNDVCKRLGTVVLRRLADLPEVLVRASAAA
jgi:hypothetical protein